VLIQINTLALIVAIGTPAQKKRYAEPMLSHDAIACLCISEPGVGSNVAEVQTRARRVGDDWIVSGQKLWISNGSWSDFAIVVCRTGEAGANEISMVLVDRRAGFTARAVQNIVLNRD